MVDKQKAITLRKQGFSYAEIAEQCGCSVSWCKVNLKNVADYKEFSNRELYEAMRDLLTEYADRVKSI